MRVVRLGQQLLPQVAKVAWPGKKDAAKFSIMGFMSMRLQHHDLAKHYH